MANPGLDQKAIIQRVSLPKDANGTSMQLVPAKTALATTYDTTISTTTQITFNAATTLIEVTAITQAILLKWGTTAVTTSNWDNVIAAGTTRHFIVPVDTTTGLVTTAVNFIEQAATAILCVSEF